MTGRNTAKLKLSDTWRRHDVFSVSLLELYWRSKRFPQSEDYEQLDDVETEKYDDDPGEYEIELILATSKEYQKKVSCFVRGVRYLIDEAIWELWKNIMSQAKDAILDFHQANPKS